MSHVDDGILHACLDGALDALADAGELPPGTTVTDITAHLQACAACSAHLRVERDRRESAAAVLRDAAPRRSDIPPLPTAATTAPLSTTATPPSTTEPRSTAEPRTTAEPRSTAEPLSTTRPFPAPESLPAKSPAPAAGRAARSHRSRRTWLPLTWAATVVLAIGAGWWGRAALREQPQFATSHESLETVQRESAPAAASPLADDQTAAGSRARRDAGEALSPSSTMEEPAAASPAGLATRG